MSRIELAYGNSSLPFEFDDNQIELISRDDAAYSPQSDAAIGAVLDSPVSSPALDELLTPGDSVLIVVSDATRATASATIVNLLVRRLIQIGISPAETAIIFATGIHRPVTTEEKRVLLTPFIFQRLRTIDHDAEDQTRLVTLGRTARGTVVDLNRALTEFSSVIITGGISFHYFAGFTGGRKSICPGLASARTIRETHMLALDFESGTRRAGVGTGLLEGNPVHEECDEIAAKIAPVFGIYSTVNTAGVAVQVFAGNWRDAHRKACDDYLQHHSVAITTKREFVIASCGGWPYDINMIQAHKALDMAAHACKDGGTIILLAECRDGLGRPDFLQWFAEGDASALGRRLRDGYEVNGQTAWALMSKAERFRIVLVSSLPNEQVERMRMIPAGSLDEAMAFLEPASSGYLLPRGAAFLPVIANSQPVPKIR